MDYKPLPIGVDNFEKLITRGYYFVDKTKMIQELLEKRRYQSVYPSAQVWENFEYEHAAVFFEDARQEDGTRKDNSGLFHGLEIMQAGENYLTYMGQYPVISLSLKSARQPNFHLAYRMLVRQIAGEFERHQFITQAGMTEKTEPAMKISYGNGRIWKALAIH